MIELNFEMLKKLQAVAILVKQEGGQIDRLRLLKLLYMAERESLAERGFPIVGGTVTAMKHGPLHSEVYDIIKQNGEEWNELFENKGHSIVLKKMPELLDLSDYEIAKLVEVHQRYGDLDTWEVVEITHEFPEWQRVYVPGTSRTIPLESILASVGIEGQLRESLMEELSSFERNSKILHRKSAC